MGSSRKLSTGRVMFPRGNKFRTFLILLLVTDVDGIAHLSPSFRAFQISAIPHVFGLQGSETWLCY